MELEPKKPKKKRVKTKRISLYLEEKDLQILDSQAENLGLNRSEFIRRMCCSKSKELEIFKEEHIKLFNQINAIGRNFNQLVKAINEFNAFGMEKIVLLDIEKQLNTFKSDFDEWKDKHKDFIKKKL